MRTVPISYVTENAIVRLPDGRLGISPNRSNRGKFYVRVQHPTEENFAVVLSGTDVVEEVELAISIVWERLSELNRQAAALALATAYTEAQPATDQQSPPITGYHPAL